MQYNNLLKIKNTERIIFATAAIIFSVYLVFGICFLNLPSVSPDENWALQVIRSLRFEHVMNDPSQPKEISPFYFAFYHATPVNQLLGIFQTIFHVLVQFAGAGEKNSIRIVSFLWSFLLIVLTYKMARSFNLPKAVGILAVAILIATPEFFTQLHTNRPEMLLGVCLVFIILLFKNTLEMNDGSGKKIKLFLIALCSWLPSILIHPSGIIIPPVVFVIYLWINRKNIFSAKAILFSLFFLPGLFIFYYTYHSIGQMAMQMGGGNYFNTQGPPMLRRATYIFSLPLIFYHRLSYFNFMSRPLSLFIFLSGFASVIFIIRRRMNLRNVMHIIIPCIAVTIFVRLMVSGSIGRFNVIVLPFIAVCIAAFLMQYSEKIKKQETFISLTGIFLIALLSSSFYGMKAEAAFNRQYTTLLEEVHKSIPENVPVLGTNLYSPVFKNQQLYHNSWMNEDAGVINLSFEGAVNVIHAKYIIADDSFIGRAVGGGRSKEWIDAMMNFLSQKCTLEKTFSTDYYVYNRVPDPKLFPDAWKYEGMKKYMIRKVCIYKVNAVK